MTAATVAPRRPAATQREVLVAGTGRTPFRKPGPIRPTPRGRATRCARRWPPPSPGAPGAVFTDRPSPFQPFDDAAADLVGRPEIPLARPASARRTSTSSSWRAEAPRERHRSAYVGRRLQRTP